MRRYGVVRTVVLLLTMVGLSGRYAEAAKEDVARGFEIFRWNTVQPIDCRTLIPRDFVPARESIVKKKVGCELARGEAESLAIGIHALGDGVKSLRLDVECDLEVRVYRGIDSEVRKMFDEMPNTPGSWIYGAYLDESNVIASVGKGRSDIFWLTVLTKPDTAPGLHQGKIRITSDYVDPAVKTVTELDLEVKVRPFVLQRARAAYAPFFYVEWGGGNALPRFAQTDEWIRRLYLDMVEHSHNSVTFYGAWPGIDLEQIPPPPNRYMSSFLPLGKEVGLFTPDVPVISFVTGLGPSESEGGTSTEHKNHAMDWLDAECRKQGWPELVSYGWDEPGYPCRGTRHAEFRKYHEPLRDVRVRVGAAMAADAAYGYSELTDYWIVYTGQITPEMCLEAQRLGAEVWTYSCHLHAHQPLNGRYYAGFYMWVYGLKGHTTWHHYAQGHFKHIWMRESDTRPMPTVGWETRRDGIDDYRYLQMLEDSIAANPRNPVAVKAQKWLDSLRQRLMGADPHLVKPGEPLALEQYDRIRSKVADYIEELGPVVEQETVPGVPSVKKWPRGLKDEGKLFRGKPVEECMQGLRDDDHGVRRAAAWALCERGPAAAPATRLLAAQLKDEEVRMPALRALEAIGAEAYPAVPEIRKLLSHSDAYIRLGATYALGAIGGGAPWLVEGQSQPVKKLSPSQLNTIGEALRVPLMDEFHWVATPAGSALVEMGAAAKPALPEAIKLLDRPYNIYTWTYPTVVRRVIAAVGPGAGQAVPKLMEIVEKKKGDARDDVLALAAIGGSAKKAVVVLEKYAADGENAQRGAAYYALFCIRGKPQDLKGMIDVLKKDEGSRAEMIRYLDALGVEARPAADRVREMIELAEFDKHKNKLQSFLEKVERGEGPVTLMP